MRAHPLLLSILAVLPGCESESFIAEACISVEEGAMTCPAPKAVSPDELSFLDLCSSEVEIIEVRGGELKTYGGMPGPACCYQVEVIDEEPNSECVPGRPYFEGNRIQLAPVLASRHPSDEAACANAWALAGAAEHASVAAFNRLSLQMLALGAPLELLRGVQSAALDEVQHAEACLKLAQHFGASDVTLGKFPFAAPIDPEVNLPELAYAAVREGCLAETLGASVVASLAQLATDPCLQPVLRQLAEDESEHAVLSFRIVAWAMSVGGSEVRDAVLAALAEPWPRLDTTELALRTGVPQSIVDRMALDAYRRVLEPATRALTAHS